MTIKTTKPTAKELLEGGEIVASGRGNSKIELGNAYPCVVTVRFTDAKKAPPTCNGSGDDELDYRIFEEGNSFKLMIHWNLASSSRLIGWKVTF